MGEERDEQAVVDVASRDGTRALLLVHRLSCPNPDQCGPAGGGFLSRSIARRKGQLCRHPVEGASAGPHRFCARSNWKTGAAFPEHALACRRCTLPPSFPPRAITTRSAGRSAGAFQRDTISASMSATAGRRASPAALPSSIYAPTERSTK